MPSSTGIRTSITTTSGVQPAGEVDRGAPVPALAHHLEVGLGVDDRREPGADQRLVVADQHPDRRGHDGLPAGMRARTTKPPPARRPALNSPPRASTRSRSPARPRPLPPGERGPRAGAVGADLHGDLLRAVAHADHGAAAVGVLEGVRQRLLHDPVGRDLGAAGRLRPACPPR